MADLKFKSTDRTLQEHFVSLAGYLENLSGLDSRDDAISKRLASILKGSKIEFVDNELRCTAIGPEAIELSKLLTLPNKEGVETPILSAADYTDPVNLLGAVKTFVEYRAKKEIEQKQTNKKIAQELYDTQKNLTESDKLVKEYMQLNLDLSSENSKLTTENVNLKKENADLNKNKKRYKPASKVVVFILSFVLAVSLMGNYSQSKAMKDKNAKFDALAQYTYDMQVENEGLKDKVVIYEAKANEFDEVVKILEDNGIDVTDIGAVSDSVQKLIDDSYLTNDDAKAMLQIFMTELEKAGLNIEDLKDENGKYSLDNVEKSMQAFVQEYMQNMAELSSIQETVNNLYKQSGLKTADGKEITPADFKSLGGEDGAISYIVNFYNSLYKEAVEEGKIKDDQIADLTKQLEDLQEKYDNLLEKYKELENSTSQTPGIEVGGSENDKTESDNKDPVADDEVKPENSTGKNEQVAGGESSDPSLDLGE